MKTRPIIFLGPPGSGKGTQSTILAKAKSLRHLSTGNLIREEIEKQSAIGKEVQALVAYGSLISDEKTWQLLEGHIKTPDFILDGFPRTILQLLQLEAYFNSRRWKPFYIEFKASAGECLKRILGRSEASRADDKPEVAYQRIQAYERQTEIRAYLHAASHLDFIRYQTINADLPAEVLSILLQQMI